MKNQELEEESTKQVEEVKATERHHLAKKIDTAGWGLFLIWVGIAFLANLGLRVGLLGVGILALGEQVASKYFNLKVDWFWVVLGLFFVVGGLWELFETVLALWPILLIVVGLALLVSAVRGKRLSKE